MLAEQKSAVTSLIARALEAMGAAGIPVQLERPKNPEHGDAACNVAMQSARVLRRAPRAIAQEIVERVRQDPAFGSLLASIEVAGPGFINMRLAGSAQADIVRRVVAEADRFGSLPANGKSVILEYVSANPTGPLHLGHARQGALGDTLARLHVTQGWKVCREYYYNDAGVQIDNLAASVAARAEQRLGLRSEEDFPESGYRGEYIRDIARAFLARETVHTREGHPVTASGDPADTASVRAFAVASLQAEQDSDLKALGIAFDNFYLESSLYTDGKVQAAVQAMVDGGYTFEKDGALWLRTTAFEDLGGGTRDDKDRVMRKTDGHYTYFVPDVAYHVTKFQRGFTRAVNIQGSDHHGTVARVRAGLQAVSRQLGLGIPVGFPDYMLHKMLAVVQNGEEVKMSKRAGTYVTLRDLVEWVGKDAARYFLVSRKCDAEFVFDIDLAVKKSDENPVYYLQYAHARICSVLAQAADKGFAVPTPEAIRTLDLSALSDEHATRLIAQLAAYPETLAEATAELAPHSVCFYLKDLAALFHTFYNAERVLVDDGAVRGARLALLVAVRQVLRNGLGLLGISAPERM